MIEESVFWIVTMHRYVSFFGYKQSVRSCTSPSSHFGLAAHQRGADCRPNVYCVWCTPYFNTV